MKRIIDANLNRASEATRVLEEIARFLIEDEELSTQLKNIRHELNFQQELDYTNYLLSRDTINDVGVNIENPSKNAQTHPNQQHLPLQKIFKSNIKRLQQALRTLAEYSVNNDETEIYEKLRYNSYTLEKIMWDKLKEKYNQIKLAEKKLYLVTNSDKFESEDDFLNAVASALKGGVDILQLREKNKSAKEIISLGKKIKELCSLYDATFIVNDRVDIALSIGADGVHLGQDDMDINSARELIKNTRGSDFIIGISTHAPEQALKASEQGADYIGVGPLYETPTKAGREAVGLEYATWAAENISIPAFGIGGVDLENLDEVLNTGIQRIAVVRAIINSTSPENSAKEFNKKLSQKDILTKQA